MISLESFLLEKFDELGDGYRAYPSANTTHGFYGTVTAKDPIDRGTKYAAAHKAVHDIGRRIGNKPIDARNYLDSKHGAAIAERMNQGVDLSNAIHSHHGGEFNTLHALKQIRKHRDLFGD